MEIRTYRAATVQQALQMIRTDLGPDAVLLRTREVRSGGLLGLLKGERCLEGTATVDAQVVGRWPLAKGRLDRGIDLSSSENENDLDEPDSLDFETNSEDE